MSRKKERRDRKIIEAVSGCESPSASGIQIEDNYLQREKYENLREQGYKVPEEHIPTSRSEDEKDLYRREKNIERLEGKRVNRVVEPYDGREEGEKEMSGRGTMVIFQYWNPEVKERIFNHVDVTDTIRITYEKVISWDRNTRGNKLMDLIIEHVNEVNPETKEVVREIKRIIHGATWDKNALWSGLIRTTEAVSNQRVVE